MPLIAVILRRGYGLGAQAMVGGSLHEPLLTVAWPSAHLGPMGLEGAVRLALRKELEAIADEAEREQRVRDLTAAAEENAKALNAAALFELDDVIDPAETRGLIASTLAAAGDCPPARRPPLRRHLVDRGPLTAAGWLRGHGRRPAPRRRGGRRAGAQARQRDRSGSDARWLRHAARLSGRGSRRQVRVEGTELVRETDGRQEREAAGRRRSGGRAGCWPAGTTFGDARSWSALRCERRAAAEARRPSRSSGPSTSTSRSRWATRRPGARATYGFSPGDEHHPEPYAYVGPWTAQPPGELWNATGFAGAELGYAELLASEDPPAPCSTSSDASLARRS